MSALAFVCPVSEPCLMGASPLWHPQEQVLYWCDIQARCLYRLNPVDGAVKRWDFESELSACAPLLGGGMLLAMRDGLWRFDAIGFRLHRVAAPPYRPSEQRFNDGRSDAQGRFWVGTLHERREDKAALHCFDRRKGRDALSVRADGMANVNGLAWSPDAHTLYWSDSEAHVIYAADHDPTTGVLSGRRVFHQFAVPQKGQASASYGGRPNGAAVDAQGCYWVAMYEGQRLVQLSPQGQILRAVDLPVRCPTMPCFGGPDLKTLYVTSARVHCSAQELLDQPLAGCVLSLSVDVPGLPVNFAVL